MTTARHTTARRVSRILAMVLTAITITTPLAAQDAQDLVPQTVKPIYVSSVTGGELRGQLLRFGPETLTLLDQGKPRDIPLVDITGIEVPGDSVKNGAIIGAAVLGVWCAIICAQGLDNVNQVTVVALINTGLGALIGAGVDAMHVGRTTIYRNGLGTQARRLSSGKASLSIGFKF